MRKKKQLTFIFSIICVILLVVFFKLGLFESLEFKSLDYRFRLFANSVEPSKEVVMVAIDENSLRYFKENNVFWPWPRDFYGALVRYLTRGGAKVIVFDILFHNPDVDRLSTDAEETDGNFAQAIQDAGNVIFASHFIPDEDLLAGDNPLVWQNNINLAVENENIKFDVFPSAILPLELFQKNVAALGAANYHEDNDGLCRRIPLLIEYKDETFFHLGLMAYNLINQVKQVKITRNNAIELKDLKVPVDDHGRFLINWYGKGGPNGSFDYYSIGALISSAVDEEFGREPTLPSSHFKDKVVIIGANAAALSDFRDTPFTVDEPYPGMEIYATMISNFLQKDFLVRVSSFIPIIAIIFFVAVIFYTFLFTHRIKLILLISLSCIILWTILSLWLFNSYKIWLDFVTPEIAVVLSFTTSAIISYQTEGRARRYLRSTFGKYLSPVVISEIIEKNEQVELGGKELRTTIYFSDIKDFTTISEKITPKDLVNLINDYLSVNTDIVLRHQGLIDKYIGDAVMAVYGAPIEIEDHARLACLAALEVQHVLGKINQSALENGEPELITRIGINTGTVVVGNIGSDLRLDYTAIGDSVNLASRLEGVNKMFSTNMMISESTFEEVKEEFVTRQLDRIQVKGKLKPISIYELIGKKGETDQKILNIKDQFHEGYHLYNEKKFKEALKIFQMLFSNQNDGPSQLYIQRCEQFIESPPPSEWDGVFKMITK